VFSAFKASGVLGLNLVQLNSVSSAISTVCRTSMRFSLRDLLLFVAFAAAIAWCAAKVGFDNGLFWFVVGILAILSGVFVHFARSERRRRALVVLTPVLALAFLSGSISVFVNSLLLSLATLILAARDRVSARTLWTISAVATVMSLLAAVIPLKLYMQELEAARRAIPTVSLMSRLQYEKRPSVDESRRELVTSDPVSSRLDDFEHSLELGAERKRQLLRLHTYQLRAQWDSA
jgi:hypothetical protein